MSDCSAADAVQLVILLARPSVEAMLRRSRTRRHTERWTAVGSSSRHVDAPRSRAVHRSVRPFTIAARLSAVCRCRLGFVFRVYAALRSVGRNVRRAVHGRVVREALSLALRTCPRRVDNERSAAQLDAATTTHAHAAACTAQCVLTPHGLGQRTSTQGAVRDEGSVSGGTEGRAVPC